MHRIDAATIRIGKYAARTPGRDGATITLPLAATGAGMPRPGRILAGAMALLSALALGYTVRAAGPTTSGSPGTT